MFKDLTPEERRAAVEAMKEKTKREMEQQEIDHKRFMENINRATNDLQQANKELDDATNKITGNDKRRCEIM